MFNLPIPPLPVPGMGLTTPIGTPVGTVVAFAGQIAASPASDFTTNLEALGWMLCDGRALEVYKYPELFAVLGYLYGGEKDNFNIPDYRGVFLRGVDGGTGVDPDASTSRTPPSKDGTKDGVGSRQEDALQIHQHSYKLVSETTGGTENKAAMLVEGATTFTDKPLDAEARTSKETRPKNVYVNYIIKYTNG